MWKIGELKSYHIILSGAALLLLIVPIVGTVYPVPAYPLNLFAYIFGAYIVGGIVLVLVRSRTKAEIESVRKVLEETAMAPMDHPAVASMPEGASPAVA